MFVFLCYNEWHQIQQMPFSRFEFSAVPGAFGAHHVCRINEMNEWKDEPMGSIELRTLKDVNELIGAAQDVDEPVVVYDGEGECLVAMRPAVFERILFDTDLLNQVGREFLRL